MPRRSKQRKSIHKKRIRAGVIENVEDYLIAKLNRNHWDPEDLKNQIDMMAGPNRFAVLKFVHQLGQHDSMNKFMEKVYVDASVGLFPGLRLSPMELLNGNILGRTYVNSYSN